MAGLGSLWSGLTWSGPTVDDAELGVVLVQSYTVWSGPTVGDVPQVKSKLRLPLSNVPQVTIDTQIPSFECPPGYNHN